MPHYITGQYLKRCCLIWTKSHMLCRITFEGFKKGGPQCMKTAMLVWSNLSCGGLDHCRTLGDRG